MRRSLLSAVLCVALVAPLVLLILLSLSRHWIYPALLPQQWQLEQWKALLHGRSGLAAAALRSFAMATIVSVSSTGLAFPLSRALSQHRARNGLLTLSHLPFAISPVAAGIGLLYLFLRLHLADTALSVVLAQFIFAFSYALILLSSNWNRRIHTLGELAATLGAAPLSVWWRIFLPMATPLIAICLFQTFLISWFDYALVLFVGGGLVDTLTIRLFEYFTSGDIRLAATCAIVLILPPLAIILVNRALALEGLAFQELRHDV